MMEWREYPLAGTGESGQVLLRLLPDVLSPQLRNYRDLLVALPPGYSETGTTHPVVYMQDGQNLSDSRTAFAGTWELDATIERLADRGIELIVVGVHHAGAARLAEYSPFPDRRHGGGDGDAYLAFIADTVKPRVDRLFRSRPSRESTTILGSSMGGLISLYAFFRYPSVFGGAGAMSPSVWFGQGAMLDFIREVRAPRGRLYVDVGTHEGVGTLRDARRLARLLVRQGFKRDKRRTSLRSAQRLRYVEDPDGRHGEWDWARRLENALEFLVG
jgi:predicted alpha/beta superfamily hydrolase